MFKTIPLLILARNPIGFFENGTWDDIKWRRRLACGSYPIKETHDLDVASQRE